MAPASSSSRRDSRHSTLKRLRVSIGGITWVWVAASREPEGARAEAVAEGDSEVGSAPAGVEAAAGTSVGDGADVGPVAAVGGEVAAGAGVGSVPQADWAMRMIAKRAVSRRPVDFMEGPSINNPSINKMRGRPSACPLLT